MKSIRFRNRNSPFSDALGLISFSFTGTAGVPPAPVAVKVFSNKSSVKVFRNKVASTVTAGGTPAVPVKSGVVEKGFLICSWSVESPTGREIASELLIGETGAHHLDRDSVFLQYRIIEGSIGHLA